jgi:general secretion pathway protein D
MIRWCSVRFLIQAAVVCGLLAFAVPFVRAQGASGVQEFEGPRAPDINRKLSAIVLPSVEFHSTSLDDAIEFLRQESRRLDTDPDVSGRGINILLKLPETSGPAGAPPATKIRVTLTLRNVPLIEALRYLASQADLTVKVEPYAVSLLPLTGGDSKPLVTAVFRVSPDFFGSTRDTADANPLDQPAAPAR